jgi:hypothetical protein
MRAQAQRRITTRVVLVAALIAIAPTGSFEAEALSPAAEQELRALYKQLIEAENAHDIAAVGRFVWKSPSALFVAKTKTPAEGNWAGFWGSDNVINHLNELYQGTFRMTPDYASEKVVLLSHDVAQTYAPLQISVGYAGQSGTPKPFFDDCRVGSG